MKPLIKLLGIICIALLTCNAVSAMGNVTENSTIIKELPEANAVINSLAALNNNSSIIDNTTLEAAYRTEYPNAPYDSYQVITKKPDTYNITCFYTKGEPFGRVQAYVDAGGIYRVLPAPMVLGKTLTFTPYNSNAKCFISAPVKSYKITNSYFGSVKPTENNVSVMEVIAENITVIPNETVSTVKEYVKIPVGTINSMGDNNSNYQFFIEIKDSIINFISNNAGGNYIP